MFPIQFISKLDNLESRCLELAFYPLRPCTQSVSHIFTSSAALRPGLVQRWSLPRRDARGHTPSLAAPAHLSTSPALASGPLAASHQGRTCPGGAPCRQGECIYLFEDVDQSQISDFHSKHQLRRSKFEVQSLIMKCLGDVAYQIMIQCFKFRCDFLVFLTRNSPSSPFITLVLRCARNSSSHFFISKRFALGGSGSGVVSFTLSSFST